MDSKFSPINNEHGGNKQILFSPSSDDAAKTTLSLVLLGQSFTLCLFLMFKSLKFKELVNNEMYDKMEAKKKSAMEPKSNVMKKGDQKNLHEN